MFLVVGIVNFISLLLLMRCTIFCIAYALRMKV